MMFAKQGYSLVVLDRSCIRPQECHLLAIAEDGDVLSAHLHPHPQPPMADTQTAKVGQCVERTIWNNPLLANNLAVHNKT